jgi:hypothetical protein
MPTIRGAKPEDFPGATVGPAVRLPSPAQAGEGVPPLPPGLTEEQFQRIVIDLARSRGWKVAHFRRVRVQRKNGSTYYETPVQADGKGFPDLLLVRGPTLIAAELKVGRNRPTPEQRDWLDALERTGWVQGYVWRPDDWKTILATLEAV